MARGLRNRGWGCSGRAWAAGAAGGLRPRCLAGAAVSPTWEQAPPPGPAPFALLICFSPGYLRPRVGCRVEAGPGPATAAGASPWAWGVAHKPVPRASVCGLGGGQVCCGGALTLWRDRMPRRTRVHGLARTQQFPKEPRCPLRGGSGEPRAGRLPATKAASPGPVAHREGSPRARQPAHTHICKYFHV